MAILHLLICGTGFTGTCRQYCSIAGLSFRILGSLVGGSEILSGGALTVDLNCVEETFVDCRKAKFDIQFPVQFSIGTAFVQTL